VEQLFATLAALITLKIKDAVCDKIRHHSGGRPAKFVFPSLATEAPVSPWCRAAVSAGQDRCALAPIVLHNKIQI
jgi:hypothetical protein